MIGTNAVDSPEGPGGDLPGKIAPAAPPCPEVARNERAFVVVDAVLAAEEAEIRQAELAAAGIRGHRLMASDCLDGPVATGVVIYTGKVYPSLQSAEAAAKGYRRIVRQLGVSRKAATVEDIKNGKINQLRGRTRARISGWVCKSKDAHPLEGGGRSQLKKPMLFKVSICSL